MAAAANRLQCAFCAMTTILIVDDHVAVRAGLKSVLRLDPAIEVAAAVPDGGSAREALERQAVDVAVVDYVLDDCDGIELACELKLVSPSLGVILYTAHEGEQLAITASIAGLDAVLGKGAPADDVLQTIRSVADGGRRMPEVSQEAVREAARRVAEDDLPILGMRLGDTPVEEIAEALHLDADEVRRRIAGIVEVLSPQRSIRK